MLQDIIRATVQKIFNDKILLGLLIVCLLGFFVGGFNQKEEGPRGPKGTQSEANIDNNTKQELPTAQTQPSPPSVISKKSADTYSRADFSPGLAVDFVKWWTKMAMDYSPQGAAQSHEAASNWMSPEAYQAFCAAFWPPELAQQIGSGATVGAFQPISVQAVAVNPDHSVVVSLTGTLILNETNGRPITNNVQIDLLVRRAESGVRIAGINNHVTTQSPY